MPITLESAAADLNRRAFLGRVAAGTLAVGLGRPAMGREPSPWYALVSDTHIAADPAAVLRDQTMARNLEAVVAGILDEAARPAGMLVDGDLALRDGQLDDYRTFLRLVEPVRAAGVPVHLTLGNHDDRANFRAAIPAAAPEASPARAVDRQVAAVEGSGLRFLMLDSLDVVNATPGRLGRAQLDWLAAELDANPEAPALVFVHHNPLAGNPTALLDTEALLAVLGPRRQAKGVVFGHTHVWNVRRAEHDLYLINLPAVAYPFTPIQPLGWVKLHPEPAGATLELRCIGGDTRADRRVTELRWRSA